MKMKIMRMTKNDLKRFGERCIRLPYGNPITAPMCKTVGWNDGVYGWNWTAYALEWFDGTIIEGYRSFPSWAIVPTDSELKELYKAYQEGNRALLVELFDQVKGEK